MFNIGDRVLCNTGGSKGRFGIVKGYSTPYAGKARLFIRFDGDPFDVELWEHRFTLEASVDKTELICKKIKMMAERQTWKKRNHV